MADHQLDAVVIGAGVAGLAAFRELSQAGCNVVCLEARNRIGGRILTAHDPSSPLPVELGAEFIHGRPPETWQVVTNAHLLVYDCEENTVHLKAGRVEDAADAWEQVEEITEDMKAVAARGEDPSFGDFIRQSPHSEKARRWATGYVEGFNAAHKELIGVASLALDAHAADAIDGDRNFRIATGYDAVARYFLSGLENLEPRLRLNAVVEAVDWQPGSASVRFRSSLTGSTDAVHARRLVITVPLGVLQELAIHPEPVAIRDAARTLCFGQVMRVVLRFEHSWWEERPDLADTGFWVSQENSFPTWWTTLPVRSPLLTGWSAGPHADRLLGLTDQEMIACALEDLSRVAGHSLKEIQALLKAAHFHNWYQDPFAKGAYSYVPAGALHRREALAQPFENTLFFAGEATEMNGHSATVHGAIATGYRAAGQVLDSLR